jgi:hypothetical protein
MYNEPPLIKMVKLQFELQAEKGVVILDWYGPKPSGIFELNIIENKHKLANPTTEIRFEGLCDNVIQIIKIALDKIIEKVRKFKYFYHTFTRV